MDTRNFSTNTKEEPRWQCKYSLVVSTVEFQLHLKTASEESWTITKSMKIRIHPMSKYPSYVYSLTVNLSMVVEQTVKTEIFKGNFNFMYYILLWFYNLNPKTDLSGIKSNCIDHVIDKYLLVALVRVLTQIQQHLIGLTCELQIIS